MNNWPHFTAACRADVDRVLRSGQLTAYRANLSWGSIGPRKGSEAYALEREIERKFKVKHGIAVNSGTAALHAALRCLDLRGREVVTSPLTFSATAASIIHAGGVPRFADVDPHTFCITNETVKRVVTKRTAAVLPVHLFGYLPDMSGLREFGLPILEDACQAVGAVRGSTYAGVDGLAGAFSFNGSKAIPAGEGGCLVTNDDKIAEKARLVVNHGCNFGSESVGYNFRMHEVVAVLARHGLRALDVRNGVRRSLARLFFANMGWMPAANNVGKHNAYYVLPFKVHDRAKLITRCARRGLSVQAGYTTPLHRLPAFKRFATHALPVAEELHDKTLCLLTNLTPDKPLSEARRTARIIREALE